MTAFVVVNPRSGGGRTAGEWPAIEAALRETYPHMSVGITKARGDATKLVRMALNEGHLEIIAGGRRWHDQRSDERFFGPEGALSPDAVFGFVTSAPAVIFARRLILRPAMKRRLHG